MRAIIATKSSSGPRAVLEQVPTPRALGPGELLVRVRAAALNPIDERILRSWAWRLVYGHSLPVVLGHDFSGEVVDTGGATRFRAGDAVYGRPHERRIGTLAEYLVVREAEVARKPERLTHEEAASIPLVGLTAWQALVDRAALAPGQRVLITAGSGGFGTFAIQLAKHLGAWVATTTGARSMDLVRALGADLALDYRAEPPEARFAGELDAVLDGRCGPNPGDNRATLVSAIGMLKPDTGVLVSLNGPPDARMATELGRGPIGRMVFASGSAPIRAAAAKRGVAYRPVFVQPSGEQLEKLTELLDAGHIRPVVDQVFALEHGAAAIDRVGSGRATGKVVVAVA